MVRFDDIFFRFRTRFYLLLELMISDKLMHDTFGIILHSSVFHKSIAPSKELCSKMALEEVGVSLP